MTKSPAGYLSLLDLMCCGFGGALLLLLLIAASNPLPPVEKPRNTLMLIRCFAKEGPLPEIRMECLRPGHQLWERVDQLATENHQSPEVFHFSAPAGPDSGSESFAMFYNPQEGLWEFRAHIVGFPNNKPAAPVSLRFEADGDRVHVEVDAGNNVKPVLPGDFTPSVLVFVSRSRTR